jgi:uncharacterized protein YjbI with pentapeptide repeats
MKATTQPAGEDGDYTDAVFAEDVDFSNRVFSAGTRFARARFLGRADFSQSVFRGDCDFSGAHFAERADFQAASFERTAFFRGASFAGTSWFRAASFAGTAWFRETLFDNLAWFERTSFRGQAVFADAVFGDAVTFSWATFAREADFVKARFEAAASCEHAEFSGGAFFSRTALGGRAGFRASRFSAGADFSGADFADDLDLSHCEFGAEVRLEQASVQAALSLKGAKIEHPVQVGPLIAARVSLDGVRCSHAFSLVASAQKVSCERASFDRAVDIQIQHADVSLANSDFRAPSVLTSARNAIGSPGSAFRSIQVSDQPGRRSDELYVETGDGQPRLLSLRGAKVAALTVAGVDLRPCCFEGAHGLEGLRLEGVTFAGTPGRARGARAGRWTRRRVIAEEHRWRAEVAQQRGWYGPEVRTPSSHGHAMRPDQIARIYRALRKGLEDTGDAPGAADFYYGEMEMRRASARHPASTATAQLEGSRAEGFVLFVYWLLSGYALRASRSLIALVSVVLCFGVLFHEGGLARVNATGERPTLVESVIYAAGTATAVTAAPHRPVTPAGEGLRVTLRIVGPLLVALTLLSIRGRVRR